MKALNGTVLLQRTIAVDWALAKDQYDQAMKDTMEMNAEALMDNAGNEPEEEPAGSDEDESDLEMVDAEDVDYPDLSSSEDEDEADEDAEDEEDEEMEGNENASDPADDKFAIDRKGWSF